MGGKMLKYGNLVEAQINEVVHTESKGKKTNAEGVMHELLTGYHLNGGKHMQNHPGVNDDGKRVSPKEAHDELRGNFTDEEYKHLHAKAKHAATAIKHHVMAHHPGGKISGVHWTSKNGDTEKITGHKATQKEDPSDLYVSVNDREGHKAHHGISLKASNKREEHLPIGNPGLESTEGGSKIHANHVVSMRRKYPALHKGPAERKEWLRSHPKHKIAIDHETTQHLHRIVKHTAGVLKKKTPEELAHHLEHHVLHSGETPAEKGGHYHWRVTTDTPKAGHHRTRIMNPHEHYKPITDAARRGHVSIAHGGTNVHFVHDGKIVASHGFKAKSRSDPLSNIGGRTTSRFRGKTYRGSKGH